MSEQELTEYLLSMPASWIDYPFGDDTTVFKYGPRDESAKLFGLIAKGSSPVWLSLKCDPQLATVLRDKYETVLPGYHLNKKHWNTILCTGQIPEDELHDLIRHSYELVKA